MKRLSFLFFFILLILGLVSALDCEVDFGYELIENDSAVMIINYTVVDAPVGCDLVLPDLIEGFPVTVIGERAFEYHEFSGGLVLPVFLEVIELRAFYTFTYAGFTGELVLPSSLKVIEDEALSNRFTGELVFPEGLIVAGGFTNTNLYGDIILPEGLTTITNTGFYQNNFNGTVYLPGSLSSIGGTAFYNNQIKEVVFSENFSISIASRMFHANLLTSLNLPEGVGSIGTSAFRANLLSGELVVDIQGIVYEFAFESNNLSSIIFGENVSQLRIMSLYGNPYLTKAVFLNKDIDFQTITHPTLHNQIFNQEHVDVVGFRYKSDGVTNSVPYSYSASRDFLTFRNIEGCMDPSASNYNEFAWFDDDSCDYSAPTGGGGGGGGFTEDRAEELPREEIVVEEDVSWLGDDFVKGLIFVFILFLIIVVVNTSTAPGSKNSIKRRKKRRGKRRRR